MFTSSGSVLFSGFGAQAPPPSQQPQSEPRVNPFGGGLSTSACFAVNQDNSLSRREMKKPPFSWCTERAPAPAAPSGFTFTSATSSSSDLRGLFGVTPSVAGSSSGGLFGSSQTQPSSTGWCFGGAPDRRTLFGQPSAGPSKGFEWNRAQRSDATRPPYAPTVERDQFTGQSGNIMSISRMPAYAHQSVEEMRLEQGNKPSEKSDTAPAFFAVDTRARGPNTGGQWFGRVPPPPPAFGYTPPITGSTGFSNNQNPFNRAAKADECEANHSSNPFASMNSPFNSNAHHNPFTCRPLETSPQGPVTQKVNEMTATWQPLFTGSARKEVEPSRPVVAGFSFGLSGQSGNPAPSSPFSGPPSMLTQQTELKPAALCAGFHFDMSSHTLRPPSFSPFGKSSLATEPSDVKPEVEVPKQPIAVPNEDFPYGSGDFGAGLVEQTVKAALSAPTAKSDNSELLALSVPASHRSRVVGSRATAFLRRSITNTSRSFLIPGRRHSVAPSRKPTSNSPPASKPIERIVVGRRDAEPWKRGGLHLKTSLFPQTIESAASMLVVAEQTLQSGSDSEDTRKLTIAATSAPEDDLDNYDL